MLIVAGAGYSLKRILLVKTSSLGDVVHNFPVASDIRRQYPDAELDWAVEEAFVPLVRLHPGIGRILPVAIRRWRNSLMSRRTWAEIGRCRADIGKHRYDAVVDTQGLVKSAVIACMARGCRHGFDAHSAREPLAARFYNVVHPVDRERHAVDRNRQLAAQSLGYAIDREADFGLAGLASRAGGRRGDEVVFLHSTSRADKLWPESRWAELGLRIESEGLTCVLPWGSEAERERSVRIATRLARASVPGRCDFPELAQRLANARAVVGVDTGLVHLSAALGTMTVALFLSTDPARTGVHSTANAINLGGMGELPGVDDVLAALKIS